MLMSRLLSELVGTGLPHRGDLEHPAQRARRGPLRGAGLPARASTRWPPSSRSSPSTAWTTATADVEGHAHVVDVVDPATVDTLDPFDAVVQHLSKVHPSRYVRLVDGLGAIGLTEVHPFTSQTDALRFVAFVDRLYDGQVAIRAEGTPLDEVFPEDMLSGGYRRSTSARSRASWL